MVDLNISITCDKNHRSSHCMSLEHIKSQVNMGNSNSQSHHVTSKQITLHVDPYWPASSLNLSPALFPYWRHKLHNYQTFEKIGANFKMWLARPSAQWPWLCVGSPDRSLLLVPAASHYPDLPPWPPNRSMIRTIHISINSVYIVDIGMCIYAGIVRALLRSGRSVKHVLKSLDIFVAS